MEVPSRGENNGAKSLHDPAIVWLIFPNVQRCFTQHVKINSQIKLLFENEKRTRGIQKTEQKKTDNFTKGAAHA